MTDSNAKGKSASDLFPGLVSGKQPPQEAKNQPPPEPKAKAQPEPQIKPTPQNIPKPPPKPDLSWLKSGELLEKARVSDIPVALVFVKDDNAKSIIYESLNEFGYQVELEASESEATQLLKHMTPAVVIFHNGDESTSIEKTTFHSQMKMLPMSKRRDILYIVISHEYKTLYNLQALTASANIVVNDKDLEHLSVIIRKGRDDYKKLFGPFHEALELYAD